MVQEEDISPGKQQQPNSASKQQQKRGLFNPLAPHQTKSDETAYKPVTSGSNASPLYKPTSHQYKPTSSPAAYKPPAHVSPAGGDSGDQSRDDTPGSDTVIQSRATITITPKSTTTTVQDSSVNNLPAFRNPSPKPFISNNNK